MAKTDESPVASKKLATLKQKKMLAVLSPTVSSPEVMLPVVALGETATQAEAPESDHRTKAKEKNRPKAKKQKLVRDSFTMPEAEYEALADVKKTCIKSGVAVKKSELLRVAVALLRKMDVADIQQALAMLTPVKAGRPGKQK